MRIRTTCLVLLALTLAATAACSRSRRYPFAGQFVGAGNGVGEIVVKHGDIPGLMPAMTMPFRVRDLKTFQQLQLGDFIKADLVQKDDDYRLENIVITARGRGLDARTRPHVLQPGEDVPDVPLTNQDGKTLHLDQFKGKAVLVTFIYTRCPFPTFCPRLSGKFATIHEQLSSRPEQYGKTHMLSISLDPAYDKPPVLKKYGLAYMDSPSGFQHWDFASTSASDLKLLAYAFGLEYSAHDNTIVHNMSTVLIAPDGRIARTWNGSEWKNADVMAAIGQAVHGQSAEQGTRSASGS